MRKYSEYAGMDHTQYLKYFKKYRRKRGMIPIYNHYDNKGCNHLRDFVLINRMRIARALARTNIRQWNN
jgi:hypothetical protein